MIELTVKFIVYSGRKKRSLNPRFYNSVYSEGSPKWVLVQFCNDPPRPLSRSFIAFFSFFYFHFFSPPIHARRISRSTDFLFLVPEKILPFGATRLGAKSKSYRRIQTRGRHFPLRCIQCRYNQSGTKGERMNVCMYESERERLTEFRFWLLWSHGRLVLFAISSSHL